MTKAKKTELNAYILLDRSGSMEPRWDESLTSVNSYVDTLAKDKAIKASVTLATFDTQGGFQFDIIRPTATAQDWKKVSREDATPRGTTPLFDAIGRIVSMADAAGHDKTIIVVMTDGQENASQELNKQAAKAVVERCKAKNWQVIFLGADFDAFGEASNVGVAASSTLNMSAGNYGATMDMMASRSVSYASSGVNMMFSAKDRDLAKGKK